MAAEPAASPAPLATPPHGWRTFLITWVSQSVSVIGSALTNFAMTIWLTTTLYPGDDQKSRLAVALSALMLSIGAPAVFVAPLAGAWADRHDRRRTMIAANVAAGLLSIVTVALIVTGRLNLFGLVLLGALGAACSAFHNAAFESSYVMLVPPARLPRANGMMQTIFALANIAGPGLAATLIALPALARQGHLPALAAPLGGIRQGAALAVGVDAATFLASALVLACLAIPSPRRADLHHAETGRRKSLWADVGEGLTYIRLRPPLLWLLSMFTVANVAAAAFVLQPLLVRFRLAPDWQARGMTLEAALALVATVGGLGGVAGGVFVSAWGGLRRHRVRGVLGGLVAGGLFLAGFGLARQLVLCAAALFVFEGLIPLISAHSQAIWQTQVPPELQGRVFSVRRLIAQASWPLGTLVMGFLGSRFDPGHIVAGCGLLASAWALLGLFNRGLMRVEDREWLEGEAARRRGRISRPLDAQ